MRRTIILWPYHSLNMRFGEKCQFAGDFGVTVGHNEHISYTNCDPPREKGPKELIWVHSPMQLMHPN